MMGGSIYMKIATIIITQLQYKLHINTELNTHGVCDGDFTLITYD